jgi:hypothetical protein
MHVWTETGSEEHSPNYSLIVEKHLALEFAVLLLGFLIVFLLFVILVLVVVIVIVVDRLKEF